MKTVNEADRPQEKKLPAPRLFFNSQKNTVSSIERLARFTLRHAVTELQITKIRAVTGLIRLRLECDRQQFDRQKWLKELEIEDRLQEIEQQLRER